MLMPVKSHIDFHQVESHQREIDARLQNWARWCNGTSVFGASPMFRMVPPPPRVRGDIAMYSTPVDRMDAQKVAKGVAALPEKHRASINWHYVKPVSPARACREIAVSMDALAKLVRDSRQMLLNRQI